MTPEQRSEAAELARLASRYMADGALTPQEWIKEFWKPMMQPDSTRSLLRKRECSGYGRRKKKRSEQD